MSTRTPIAGHPDLTEIRQRYEAAAETPTAQVAVGMTMLAGLFVALSPWITGFSAATPSLALNNLVIGLAAAVLALSFAAAYQHTHGIAWTCPVLGAWTVVSVFVMSGTALTATTVLSNVIGGAVLVLAGAGLMGSAMTSRSRNT
ncbi:SPW repeat protein [Saccharopolyspora sp. HNM0983]|uniref:SPW repeat protein n=1 Tax=Saccharopolyspora montiporae TaxID=2781240 RepID=A0A929B956_9PSEU|nr:SPW repeat protein [Saccharopolyspora sp. HNM0983]MBE9375557.1 SPW repeat protein [Saccharopolyspora sp. HNM0983]